jgi:peptidoglycan/LPS O-acetylase OafA/YrhL
MRSKNTQNRMKKLAAVAVLILATGVAVWSQGPIPPPPPPLIVPIDGGIVILAAAGAAYGAKKVYGKRKK